MDVESIGRRVAEVRERIRLACDRVGRDPTGVTLVAVSKSFPERLILTAHEAGLRHFGENKAQEFREKFDAVDPAFGERITWHFIGHLQRNKVKLVAGKAHLIHGVDSLRLARALQEFADKHEMTLRCLVQVNVSGEASKFGVEPPALHDFLLKVRSMDRISFEGLMTLASPTDDIPELRREFTRLRNCRLEAQEVMESMTCLSMGMSADYEIAVEEGATHVRLGTALFGPRGG